MIEFSLRITLTVICLGLVVVIHELGHLVMANKLGVRVMSLKDGDKLSSVARVAREEGPEETTPVPSADAGGEPQGS